MLRVLRLELGWEMSLGGCSGLWVTPGKSQEGLEGPGIACRFLGGAAGL